MVKLVNFTNPRPQFSDVNGTPLALGRVFFYEAGTTNLKTVYADADKASPAMNPHPLDAGGFVRDGGVFLGEGRYTILVQKEVTPGSEVWADEWTVEDVPGTPSLPGQLTGAIIGNLAQLRLLDPGVFGTVFITGYYEAHDRGEGWFFWNSAATAADNGGTVISANGNPTFGRWERLLQQAEIIPQIFGGMDATSVGVSSNFQSMIGWCNEADNEEYRKITVPPGSYFIDGNVSFDEKIDLEISNDAFFTSHPATSGTLTITCTNVNIRKRVGNLVLEDIDLLFNPTDQTIRVNPNWFKGAPNFESLQLCATTSGTRDFSIDSNLLIEVADSGTLDLPNMYFEKEALFDNQSTSGVITISSIIADEGRDLPILVNEFKNVRIVRGVVKAEWFSFVSGSRFDEMIFSITNGETLASNLTWGRNRVFPISGASNSSGVVTHIIEAGCNIQIDNDIEFHEVVAGRYQIFDTNATSRPTFSNGNVFPEWFGMKGSDQTVATMNKNALAFEKLLSSMNGLSRRVLGDAGITYYFDDTISNLFGGTFKFNDMILDFSNSTSTGTLLELTAPLEWDNVHVIGNSSILTTIFKSNSVVSKLVNCSFVNGGNRSQLDFSLCTNLKVKESEFTNVDLNFKGGSVYNSVFSRSNLVIKRIFISSNGENIPLDVRQNEFKFFGETAIEQSKIEFRGDAANTVFLYITVRDNFFSGDQSGFPSKVYMIFTTNANADEHRVDIYDNTTAAQTFVLNLNNVEIPTTRFDLRFTLNGTSGTEVITLPTEMLILTGRADVPISTQASLSLDASAGVSVSMNFQANYPNIEYFWSQSLGSFSELYIEIRTAVRDFDYSYGGHA